MSIFVIFDGYGYYVWVAYAITFIFLGVLIIYMAFRRKKAQRQYINLKNSKYDKY